MRMSNDYYVYIHVKPNTGEIFYVGKGRGNRAYQKRSRNDLWQNVVNKYGVDIFIIEEGLTNEEACIIEERYISHIGRRDLGTGTLVNMTKGGDGRSGFNHTDEFKSFISQVHKGKKRSKEHIEKMKKNHVGFSGRKHSEETKEIIREKSRIYNSREVIDLTTGKIYESAKVAARELEINYSTLKYWLRNTEKNKSSLKWLENE